MEQLIKNVVSQADQDRFSAFDPSVTDVDLYPKLIFVASLWSGTSRLALRGIAEAVEGKANCRVQLVDSDSLVGQVLFGLISSDHHGNGVLIAFDQGHFRLIGSGKDLNALKTFIREKLT